jgi:hypothetical protein
MPGAAWIGPTVNRNPGAEGTVYGLVLHIQQGTEAGTEAWQRNPASQISSHFLAPKGGGLRQMVDTADKAWCEAAGNAHWISVECEGFSGQHLTLAQVEACAQLLAWLHNVYAVPLRYADDPHALTVAAGGLGYHAMGGAAWGNHPDCPGGPVISQRGAMIARAQQLTGDTMSSLEPVERKELDDIDYTTTHVPMPDGTVKPVHVAIGQVLALLTDIKAALPPGTLTLSGTVSGTLSGSITSTPQA